MGNQPVTKPIEMQIIPNSDTKQYASTDQIKVGCGVIVKIESKLSLGYLIYTFWPNAKTRLYVSRENYPRTRSQLFVGKSVVIQYLHHNDYLEIVDVLPLPTYTVTDVIVDFLPIIVEGTLGENSDKSYTEVILAHGRKGMTLYILSERVDPELKNKKCTLTFSMIGAPHIYGITDMVEE